MANVISSLWIECRRCGSRIKLSPKSTFDPFHWTKHRERCLRRPAGVVKEMRAEARPRASHTPQPPSSTLSSPPPSPAPAATPPLTPDASSASSVKHEHESPPPPEPSPPPPALPPHSVFTGPDMLAFEEYLHRSRRRPTRLVPPPTAWQDWSWSQLQHPVWVVAQYPSRPHPGAADGKPPEVRALEGGLLAPDAPAPVGRSVSVEQDLAGMDSGS
ncbi:hypothetical protein BV25DRAFT_1827240 [Artomyces pyxidatus]|uniref:Uncharacterized protein n=1 Tax=Artomyces pyxidatus TaxID=48021 RepID=A0ACB8SWY1_9AGAM|nr:hypothetical protein BV25DRAFT_1827240 [Artomyces pyxidatus]